MAHRTAEWSYDRPERRESLAEQVHQQLCRAIQSGAYAPSERINIRRLAAEIGVSVTPAREAVLRLISDDILQISDKGAVFVPLRAVDELTEIFEVRRFLEGGLAARAAEKLTEADVAYLEETQSQFLEAIAVEDYKKVLRLNSLLHFRIYRLADLPVWLKIVEGLWLKIGPTLRHMYPMLRRNRQNRRHEDIIEAARSRDAEALRKAILADLETSEDALGRYLAQHNGGIAIHARRSKVA